jgi:hypothetical protein
MSYTFGASAANDITWGLGQLTGNQNTAFMVCGWFRPTAVTAGRSLWSFGNTGINAKWSATAGELDLVTNNVTTDGVWRTTGAGFAADNWYFIASLYQLSLATANITLWIGLGSSLPVKYTLTNTGIPSGNNTGATAIFYLGNLGTSTTAGFVGQIGSCSLYQINSSVLPNPLGLSSFTALSQAEEDFVFQNYVFNSWSGNPFPMVGSNLGFVGVPATTPTWQMVYIDMEQALLPRAIIWGDVAIPAGTSLPTNNGGVFSQERPPVTVGMFNTNVYPGFRRR